MIMRILTWLFCGLCLMLEVQSAGLVLDHRPRNHRAVNILFSLLVTAPSIWLTSRGEEAPLPYPLRLTLFLVYFLGQAGAFFLVYRKVNKRLLYFFLLTMNIPQMFTNVCSAFTDNGTLSDMISFAATSAIFGLLMFSVKRKGQERFLQDIVRSLPARVYVIILVFSLVASIHVVAENALRGKAYISLFQLIAMGTLIAAVLSVVRISISESEKRSSVELLSKQVENQIEYYEKINKIYGEFRSFRHDYKNHVLCLRGLIAAGKTDEALEYMETMGDMSSVEKNRYHTGNVIIDALLDDKSEKAQAANAQLVFTGSVPDKGITNADLCIIMANAIDNAIEACAKDDTDSPKEIKLEADIRQGYFFFKASNPMFEAVEIKDKNTVATSKSDKERHGFGISNIAATAEKYEGETNISADNGVFCLEITLHLGTQQ